MDDGGICRSRGRDGRDRWKRATSGGGNKTGLHVMRQGTRSWNESRNGSAQNRRADVGGEASVVDIQRWSCRRRRRSKKEKKTGDAGELIEAKSKRARGGMSTAGRMNELLRGGFARESVVRPALRFHSAYGTEERATEPLPAGNNTYGSLIEQDSRRYTKSRRGMLYEQSHQLKLKGIRP